jgi:hypothetical protein
VGVVLTPKRVAVEALSGSFWAWRPVVNLLREASIVDLESMGPVPDSFLFAEVDGEQATRIADFLDGFLPRLGLDGRLLLDGSITDVEDTGEFYRNEAEAYKNYSTPKKWLVDFRDFCRTSGGFTVY